MFRTILGPGCLTFVLALAARPAEAQAGDEAPKALPAGETPDAPPAVDPAEPPSAAPQPAPGPGNEGRGEPIGGEYRVINDHRFILPGIAESAILNTSLGFTQGLGVFTFDGIDFFSGEPRDARLFLYNQGFFGSIGILNRIAVDLRISGLAAVGGDLNDILVVGALADLGAGGLAKVRLFTLDDIGLQVAVGAGLFYNRSIVVSPSAIVAAALDDGLEAARDAIVRQQESTNVRPALMVAEGYGPLGVQASVGAQVPIAGEDVNTSLDAAAQVSFDLLPLTDVVPVGFTGEYGITLDLGGNGSDASTMHSLVGGLYYTGRQAFEPGLAVLYSLPGENQQLIVGQMVMHYYF